MRPTPTMALLLAVLAGIAAAGAQGQVDDATAGSPAPVIVELFTSEGCSSCPPADDLLGSLARNQPVPGALIIPLSEHVDYWDRLGWRDPFSSPRFTARQRDYARAFDAPSIYTPQMVVDGRLELVGSHSVEARAAIRDARDARKVPVDVAVSSHPNSRVVQVSAGIGPDRAAVAAEPLGVWLAVTESGLVSDVRAGENRFRRLHHTGVVRHLERLDTVTADAVRAGRSVQARLRLEADWQRDRLRAVVFLQERERLRIVGAGLATLGRVAGSADAEGLRGRSRESAP